MLSTLTDPNTVLHTQTLTPEEKAAAAGDVITHDQESAAAIAASASGNVCVCVYVYVRPSPPLLDTRTYAHIHTHTHTHLGNNQKIKDQLNILAGAKLPPQQQAEDAKNLMTPGGALFGMHIDSRLGGMVPGCTPKNGTELRFLVESTYIHTHTHTYTHIQTNVAVCVWRGSFSSLYPPSLTRSLPHTHTHTHTDTTCPVITLLPGGNYTLSSYILVKPGRRVSVIGRYVCVCVCVYVYLYSRPLI